MKFANQKKITIQRNMPKKVKGNGRTYIAIYSDTLFNAAKSLTAGAFKVYLYLVSNSDGFNLNFSPQHVIETMGISRSTVYRGMEELTENGYLIDHENSLTFYDEPQLTHNQAQLTQDQAQEPKISHIFENDFCLKMHNEDPCKVRFRHEQKEPEVNVYDGYFD